MYNKQIAQFCHLFFNHILRRKLQIHKTHYCHVYWSPTLISRDFYVYFQSLVFNVWHQCSNDIMQGRFLNVGGTLGFGSGTC